MLLYPFYPQFMNKYPHIPRLAKTVLAEKYVCLCIHTYLQICIYMLLYPFYPHFINKYPRPPRPAETVLADVYVYKYTTLSILRSAQNPQTQNPRKILIHHALQNTMCTMWILRGFCICGFCTLRKMDNVVYLYTYTSARTVSLQKTICTTLRFPFCAVCKIHKCKIHAKSTSTTHCKRRFALLYQSTSYFLPCIHNSKKNSRAARTTTKFLAAPVALFCASELSN